MIALFEILIEVCVTGGKTKKVEKARRKFLKIVSHILGGALAAGILAPLAGFLAHPLLKKTVYGTEDFIRLGSIDDFPIGIPKKMPVTSSKMDAWNIFEGLVMGSVWVIRQKDNSLQVLSTNCPHLGCGIDWGADVNKFLCPCHEGVFDIQGKVLSGPSPRSMYSFKTKIENNTVLVDYKNLI
ncbi:MAG: ubiquinol-cytochrome c reductase iron-sulfur subunit [Candidatus Brocadiaceae bacterium]|nr:ubiquinol-cytochrome c reductase iron-sulfur subunit [Candidatus Brocadiaceae bacterium]